RRAAARPRKDGHTAAIPAWPAPDRRFRRLRRNDARSDLDRSPARRGTWPVAGAAFGRPRSRAPPGRNARGTAMASDDAPIALRMAERICAFSRRDLTPRALE